MTRQLIIQRTIEVINQLPQEKAIEISDFAEFLIKKYEEQLMLAGIMQLNSDSKTFEFLAGEEELYTVNDLKERFNND
jgi:hypothetical protein